MKEYSTKEASETLGISVRVLQKRCRYHDIRKRDNKYLITDENIELLRTVLRIPNERNEPTNTEPFVKTTKLDVEIESLKAINKELKDELKTYDIDSNERIEVFTNEEYLIFEKRLIEWRTQSKELIHQEQLFNAEKKSLTEISEHYKNQFDYQKKQSDKILQMHQVLLDQIAQQNKLAIQRNVIEAKEKDVINKDWKPK